MIKNIVFAGTPSIAADLLSNLIEYGYPISACLTRPDKPQGRNQKLSAPPVKEVAIKNGIPCLQPSKIRDPITINYLQGLRPDIMIVFAYGFILPQEILSIPTFGCFNIHTSLLPKFRGAAPVQHTILAGEEITGISVIKMSPELDSGEICYQLTCSVTHLDTSKTLYNKLQPLANNAILAVLNQLDTNSLTLIEQDHSKATYANKINKSDARINWSQTTTQIDRLIRAFVPHPVAFTLIAGTFIRIWQAAVIPSLHLKNFNTSRYSELEPGDIINFTKHGIDVVTSDGMLRLEKVQFPGGKTLNSVDLFNSTKYRQIFTTHKNFE